MECLPPAFGGLLRNLIGSIMYWEIDRAFRRTKGRRNGREEDGKREVEEKRKTKGSKSRKQHEGGSKERQGEGREGKIVSTGFWG